MDPLEYLTPFLETVKSPETSGPITLVALSALHKIIARGVLGGCWPGQLALLCRIACCLSSVIGCMALALLLSSAAPASPADHTCTPC